MSKKLMLNATSYPFTAGTKSKRRYFSPPPIMLGCGQHSITVKVVNTKPIGSVILPSDPHANPTGLDVSGTISTPTAALTSESAGCPAACAAPTASLDPYILNLCVGSTLPISLGTGSTTGGTWSCSGCLGGIISYTTGSDEVFVTGLSIGVGTITYTVTNCAGTAEDVAIVNVTPPPTITGSSTVCIGGSDYLYASVSGGYWHSLDPSIASVSATTGMVTGVSLGTTTISYITPSCLATTTVTVQTLTSAITGTTTYCIGGSGYLFTTGTTGTWTSGNPAVATITATTGHVNAISTGTAVITFTNSCGSVTTTITVNPYPPAITGPSTVCAGETILLSDGTPGGSWSSTIPYYATVDALTGTVTSVNPGTTSIYYSLGLGCSVSWPVTVIAGPDPILGPSPICPGYPTIATDAPSGGNWTSTCPTILSIDFLTGDISTFSAGICNITYTMPSTGCYAVYPVTVNVAPAAIIGPTSVCVGASIALTDAISGGTWISSDPTAISINSLGIATGITAGSSAWIYYTLPDGCFTMVLISVPLCCPAACVPEGETELTGDLVTSPTPGNYFINTPVTISGPIFFNNCIITMGPLASITVNPGYKLTLIHSHLYSCGTDMWQGIILATGGGLPTGQLELTGSTLIEDAQVAVSIDMPVAPSTYIPDGATSDLILYSHGATFNKNKTGIKITTYTPFVAPLDINSLNPAYPFVIENTIFTCRLFCSYVSPSTGLSWPLDWPQTAGTVADGALKAAIVPATPYDPPYNLDNYWVWICNDGHNSEYGIYLNGVGSPISSPNYPGLVTGGALGTPDDLNLFDNMYNGIYAVNSSLISRNSGFMHMFPNYFTGGGGYGIYSNRDAIGAAADAKYQLYVYGIPGTSYTNQFWDCSTAVGASELYDIIGIHAVMSSKHGDASDPQGQFGYNLSSSEFYEIQTNANYVYNISVGISSSVTPILYPGATANLGQVTSAFNHISAVNPEGGTNLYGEFVNWGINVFNPTSGIYSTISGDEVVSNNIITASFNGILIQHDPWEYTISTRTNQISLVQDPSLMPGDNNQAGIKYIDAFRSYAYNNTVTGPGYNVPIPPSYSSLPYNAFPIIEAFHFESCVGGLSVSCNTATNINTGYYFSGNSASPYWVQNTMTKNAYGFALNGNFNPFILGPGGFKIGNQWSPATGDFSWGGASNNWQTYTIGTTDAAFSYMNVRNTPAEAPTANSGDPSSIPYVYTPAYGMDHTSITPLSGCYASPLPFVPIAMRSAHDSSPNPPSLVEMGSLTIIPNPNNGTFTIQGQLPDMEGSRIVNMEINDMLGRTLFTATCPFINGGISKVITLDEQIADGVYLVKINNEHVSKVLRFVLKR